MAGSASYHDGEALKFAARAEDLLAKAARSGQPGQVTAAQAFATLALAHRTAEQTAMLGQYLGDDSHLDGLKVTLRDISDGFAAGQP
jgi:hypothetical protein